MGDNIRRDTINSGIGGRVMTMWMAWGLIAVGMMVLLMLWGDEEE